MYRLGSAILLFIAVLLGRGSAQDPDTTSGDAQAAMAREWKDTSSFVFCLKALDLYTRTGADDPQFNATLALSKLTSGNPSSVEIYLDAQSLLGRDGMTNLLATASTTKPDQKDKDYKAKREKSFQDAAKAITAAFQHDRVRLDHDVNQWFVNDPPRALYGLLRGIVQDEMEYARIDWLISSAQAASDAAEKTRIAAEIAYTEAETALAGASNAKTVADTALADAQQAAGVANAALISARSAQAAADTALASAQEAAKAAEKGAKHAKPGESADHAADNNTKAGKSVQKAQTAKADADRNVAAAATANADAGNRVNVAKALQTAAGNRLASATTAQDNAKASATAATSARDNARNNLTDLEQENRAAIAAGKVLAPEAKGVNDVQQAAIDLMELYRTCYALNPDKLFRLVHAHFK